MRVWIRKLPEEHHSYMNMVTAANGFSRLGASVEYHDKFWDIKEPLSPDDIVVDGVSELKGYFDSKGILTGSLDYPDVLLPFAGRKIWKDYLGNAEHSFIEPVFVKPVEEKLFPGCIILTHLDWGSVYMYRKNTWLYPYAITRQSEVYCSEVIDVRSEFRVFIRYDRVLDVRPYRGDYHYPYNPEELDKMLQAFVSWEGRPAACAMDIAVTGDGKTVFLELNDGYAIGAYGLNPIDYAMLLATRWTQLTGSPDPFV